jgi:YidC/Oxa1 family membrane protein insertase
MTPNQPDTKNLALAIAISLAILLGFQYFFAEPQAAREQAQVQAQRQAVEQKKAVAEGKAAPTESAPVARPQALALSPRVAIDAPGVDGTLSMLGGRFDDLRLKRYKETVKPNSAEITLLHPQGTADGYYAFFGWSAPDGGVAGLPGPNTVWSAPADARLTPATPVTLTHDNGAGLVFTRTVAVDENYMFTITDTVRSAAAGATTLTPYGAVRRHARPKSIPNAVNHEGAVGVVDGKLKRMKYQDLGKGQAFQQTSTGGWLGFADHFWLAALIPDQTQRLDAAYKITRLPGEEVYETSYIGAPVALAPGGSISHVQHFYAGSKRVSELRAYGEALNLPRFDDAVDWGMLWFLTKPFYWLMMEFYKLVGTIGVAILLVTVVVKVVTFPLVYTSYKSFARLRDLAPKMKELQERFGEDKQRQQQEMIKLYQTEKINPVAGCIPALLQMPIFFALFKVLSVSLELRHAPFYGWIPDLSAKDPTTIFNLFGLLPFDPTAWPVIGGFLAIGAWPILYGLSFWLLQKMQPTATDPMQAQIFALMPWLFVIIFAGFASGLVIYYTWSNLLTIVQQYVIAKRTGSSNPIDEFFAKLGKSKPAGTS